MFLNQTSPQTCHNLTRTFTSNLTQLDPERCSKEAVKYLKTKEPTVRIFGVEIMSTAKSVV